MGLTTHMNTDDDGPGHGRRDVNQTSRMGGVVPVQFYKHNQICSKDDRIFKIILSEPSIFMEKESSDITFIPTTTTENRNADADGDIIVNFRSIYPFSS